MWNLPSPSIVALNSLLAPTTYASKPPATRTPKTPKAPKTPKTPKAPKTPPVIDRRDERGTKYPRDFPHPLGDQRGGCF